MTTSEWREILVAPTQHHQRLADPGLIKELRRMSITQYRANVKRARQRRRLYARINNLPDSTVRNELLAIAHRHDFGDR